MTRDELQRLINLIVQELSAAQAVRRTALCACHSVNSECCPNRLQGVIDAGATWMRSVGMRGFTAGSSFLPSSCACLNAGGASAASVMRVSDT